jgi:NADH-quinone oxidoreductase subunit E
MNPSPVSAASSKAGDAFRVSVALERTIDELISRYPQPRSALLMVLHALQDSAGYLSKEAIEWTASKLGLQPINVLELVTFYPMLRQQPVGKHHFKICRTLSCALGGSHQLHAYLCEKLGLDPKVQGPQTTADGRVTVEFVECLASCHTAPALMVNDDFFESVTPEKMAALLQQCAS